MRVPRDFRETRRRLTAALVEVRASLQSRRPDAERVSGRNAVERNSPPWEVVKRRTHVPDWHTGSYGDEVVPDPEGAEPAESQYKYADPVRKQADRALLPAGYCAECARFYTLLGRPPADCHHAETSRHRRRWQAPESPPDFWHLAPPEPHSP